MNRLFGARYLTTTLRSFERKQGVIEWYGGWCGVIKDDVGKEYFIQRSSMARRDRINATAGIEVLFDVQEREEEGKDPWAVNVTSRDGKPFPKFTRKLVAKGVSGTLQDNTVIFEKDGQKTIIKLDDINMEKSKDLLEKQPISITFDLHRRGRADQKKLFARQIEAAGTQLESQA